MSNLSSPVEVRCTITPRILNELLLLTPMLAELEHIKLPPVNSANHWQVYARFLYSIYSLECDAKPTLSFAQFNSSKVEPKQAVATHTTSARVSQVHTGVVPGQLSIFDMMVEDPLSTPTSPPILDAVAEENKWVAHIRATHNQSWVWIDTPHMRRFYSQLTQGTNELQPFRQLNVGIVYAGRMVRKAIEPARIDGYLSDLFKTVHNSELHPLIASMLIHYELYYSYPFMSHNHFVSCYWHYLLAQSKYKNYPLLNIFEYFVTHFAQYKVALEQSDKASDAANFVEFALQGVRYQLTTLQQQRSEAVNQQLTVYQYQRKRSEISDPVKRLLLLYRRAHEARFANQTLMTKLKLKHRPTFKANYLGPALQLGLLAMVYPHTPKHPQQQYILTDKGLAALQALTQRRNKAE